MLDLLRGSSAAIVVAVDIDRAMCLTVRGFKPRSKLSDVGPCIIGLKPSPSPTPA